MIGRFWLGAVAAFALTLSAGAASAQTKEEYVRELFEKRLFGWSVSELPTGFDQHKAIEQDCVISIESMGPSGRVRVRIDFKQMAVQSLSRDVLYGLNSSGTVSMLGPDDAVTISGATNNIKIIKGYAVFGSLLPQYPKIFEYFITDICPGTNRRF